MYDLDWLVLGLGRDGTFQEQIFADALEFSITLSIPTQLPFEVSLYFLLVSLQNREALHVRLDLYRNYVSHEEAKQRIKNLIKNYLRSVY